MLERDPSAAAAERARGSRRRNSSIARSETGCPVREGRLVLLLVGDGLGHAYGLTTWTRVRRVSRARSCEQHER